MKSLWKDEIRKICRGGVLFDEPLSKYTSYQIGGPADVYVIPDELEDLKKLVLFTEEREIARFIIGLGSNILVSDQGIRGLVIDLRKCSSEIKRDENRVWVGAGRKLWDFLNYLRDEELVGFQNLIGIPGTVGGAIKMNAGAFGVELFDRVLSVDILEPTGEIIHLKKENIDFGYRRGIVPGKRVFLGIGVELEPGNKKEIAEQMKQTLTRREAKQPLEYPSAGSVFKRPPGDYAGRLIEESGCKGLRVGKAQVSEKHAGFIINLGGARAEDVRKLMDIVQERVLNQFGVQLKCEIEMIGFN
ncbi:MAG: UDP-N-acetylmuramate dehydrogenase [bacterium]